MMFDIMIPIGLATYYLISIPTITHFSKGRTGKKRMRFNKGK